MIWIGCWECCDPTDRVGLGLEEIDVGQFPAVQQDPVLAPVALVLVDRGGVAAEDDIGLVEGECHGRGGVQMPFPVMGITSRGM